jgi:hypothetical protein
MFRVKPADAGAVAQLLSAADYESLLRAEGA